MIDAAGLRVMKAIADEGSFTGAAMSLGYTQPAISQMVRRLEQRTGTVLVDRVGRTVRLTEAGQVLARHASTVLAGLDAAEEELAAITGLRAGRVRLASFPSASATIVPPALAAMHREFPDVEIRLAEQEPPEALASLRGGECDVAIVFVYEGSTTEVGASDLEGLSITQLLDDEVRIAMPHGHPNADDDVVSLADLAEFSWVAGCPRCRVHVVAMAQEAGFFPKFSYEIEDYVAQLGLVAADLGVALIPDLILGTAPHPDVAIRPTEPPSRRRIMAVTTPDLAKVPAVERMLASLESAAAEVAERTAQVAATAKP